MALRDTLRLLTPQFLLDAFRNYKRGQTRNKIQSQIQKGETLNQTELVNQFKGLGITTGDHVLIHCAFSKIGAVENGPLTFIEALKIVIGEEGNILMPSSPNGSFQEEYLQNLKYFDVQNSPSKMGAVSEVFRKMKDVQRSAQPTEPICVWGKDASWYVENHENDRTPYGPNSPFFKLAKKGGKILYIGVTLDNAGTSLHVLEDSVDDFKYPVYAEKIYNVEVINNGVKKMVSTKAHNPEQSKKRQCDGLLPMFETRSVAVKKQFGAAATWVFDAQRMLEIMIEEYHQNGVTMYTPKGEN